MNLMYGVIDLHTNDHLVKGSDEYHEDEIDALAVKPIFCLDGPLNGMQLTYQVTPDMRFKIIAFNTDEGDIKSECLDGETGLLNISYKGRKYRYVARKSILANKPWWKLW